MDTKYHIVSVQSNNFRGRKKRPGNLIFDPSTQRLAVFIGYCANCNSKFIADKQTISLLTKNYNHSRKSIAAKILLAMAKKLES